MRTYTRRQRIIRTVISLVLALIASVRAGGVALACEVETAAPSHAQMDMPMQMDGMSMTSHDDAPTSCDEPERARECALMVACAPATAPSCETDPSIAIADAEAIASPAHGATTVDRAPEPPPPRA